MRTPVIIVVVSIAALVAGCGKDGADSASGDSTASGFEKGMEQVGKKLETAAKDVKTEVNESRIQMVIDNIRGMDSVQAEVADDGSVTLIGSVADEATRAEAERLVRSIEGVTTVKNAIGVGASSSLDSARAHDTVAIDTSGAKSR
jgi:osmotically-inducible protein OsmY